ncbi:MAG: hypothetical protein QW356_08850, partial [Candidatus Hadarchaeales archaeon]
VGRIVKIVYVDGVGNEAQTKVRKGRLVGVSSEFLTLRTYTTTYLIARPSVRELRELEGGGP